MSIINKEPQIVLVIIKAPRLLTATVRTDLAQNSTCRIAIMMNKCVSQVCAIEDRAKIECFNGF